MNVFKERCVHAFESQNAPQLAALYGQMSQAIIDASPTTDLFLGFGRSVWLLIGDLLRHTPQTREALMGKTVLIIPEYQHTYGDLAYLAEFFRMNAPEVMTAGSVTLLDDTASQFTKIQNFERFFTGIGTGFKSIVLASSGMHPGVTSILSRRHSASGTEAKSLYGNIRAYYNVRKSNLPHRLTIERVDQLSFRKFT